MKFFMKTKAQLMSILELNVYKTLKKLKYIIRKHFKSLYDLL